jgi:hypothetical protein
MCGKKHGQSLDRDLKKQTGKQAGKAAQQLRHGVFIRPR